jgi:hypothetical protein
LEFAPTATPFDESARTASLLVDEAQTPKPFVDIPLTPESKVPEVDKSWPSTPAFPFAFEVLLDLV